MTIEVPIPGVKPGDPEATATLREPHEVTERHRRPIKLLAMQLNPGKFAAVMGAEDDALPDIELSEREATSMASLADHTILSALVGWTLDLPIPSTVDEVMDLPGHIYDALEAATSGIGEALAGSVGADVKVETNADGQTVTVPYDPYTLNDHTAEDKTSPTGASAD